MRSFLVVLILMIFASNLAGAAEEYESDILHNRMPRREIIFPEELVLQNYHLEDDVDIFAESVTEADRLKADREAPVDAHRRAPSKKKSNRRPI